MLLTVAFLCLVLPMTAQPAGESNAGSQVWGGDGVQMEITGQGATLQFPCADGSILAPLKASANGEFTARGTYTPGQFGPVRKDNPPRDLPAIYQGKISGDTMQLQIELSDKTLQPPAMTLTRGKTGRVVRCH